MSNYIFTGFPHVGKTSFAKLCAEKLALSFLDTDEMLAKKNNVVTAKLLYEQVGEERFRNLESQLLPQLLNKKKHIIALGGGFLLHPKNAETIKMAGQIIYLYMDLESIWHRLGKRENMPISFGRKIDFAAFKDIYLMRDVIYKRYADIIIKLSSDYSFNSAFKIVQTTLEKFNGKQ